jgi:hypothetical protein
VRAKTAPGELQARRDSTSTSLSSHIEGAPSLAAFSETLSEFSTLRSPRRSPRGRPTQLGQSRSNEIGVNDTFCWDNWKTTENGAENRMAAAASPSCCPCASEHSAEVDVIATEAVDVGQDAPLPVVEAVEAGKNAVALTAGDVAPRQANVAPEKQDRGKGNRKRRKGKGKNHRLSRGGRRW